MGNVCCDSVTGVQRDKQSETSNFASPDSVVPTKDDCKTLGKTKALLDDYTLGEILGQGAFGVVYECRKNTGGEFDYAVKMVDKVETPVAEIKKEANFIKILDHPNVVKFHGVYFEKVFVCIVMTRYRGGDLIEGMQAHWKAKGKIPVEVTAKIVKQMTAAIDHLHSRNICHRDVKGDNYLMDRLDITDPALIIIITDFGTAVELKPGERCRTAVGTKMYWSPEFYGKNYSFKVDLWAIGVVMYGLLEGKFPFKTEKDAKSKELRLSPNVASVTKEFLFGLLERKEDLRFDAATAMAHEFLKNTGVATTAGAHDDDKDHQPEAMREAVNGALGKRREELVNRLEEAKNRRRASMDARSARLLELQQKTFDLTDQKRRGTANRVVRYEWVSAQEAQKRGISMIEGMTARASVDVQADVDGVRRNLVEHGIDIASWGKGEAKTVAEFAAEVLHGKASLMLDASDYKKLVRVVDVVLVRLCYVGDDGTTRYLIETSETYPDGRSRGDLNRLPGTKKEPYENRKRTGSRVVEDMIGLSLETVTFAMMYAENFEESELSRSYPGVQTVYRKEILECKLSPGSKHALMKKIEHKDSHSYRRTFVWFTEQECEEKSVKYKMEPSDETISALVQAPVGFNEEQLQKFLEENRVDPAKFGVNGGYTLENFSNELLAGDSTLQVVRGTLGRFVHIMQLALVKKTGEILTEAAESKDGGKTFTKLDRLPASKHRTDESPFHAIDRLLYKQLGLSGDACYVREKEVYSSEEVEDSHNYPGIRTRYIKKLVYVDLSSV